MATSVYILNIIQSCSYYLQSKTKRKLFLLIGNVFGLASNVMYQMFYFDNNNRTIKSTINALILGTLAIYILLIASCQRYFMLLGEKNQAIANIAVPSIVAGFLMYVTVFACLDIIKTPQAQLHNIKFSKWAYLLVIIPLCHLLFGILGFVKIARQRVEMQSIGFKIVSTQSFITFVILILWIVWTGTYALGVSSGASNSFLLAVGYMLENSVMIISKSIRNRLNNRSAPHSTSTRCCKQIQLATS